MLHRRAYRFRLKPSARQREALRRYAGARRFAWNWALARRKEYYRVNGRGIPNRQLFSELTAVKKQPDTAWLKTIDAQLLQQPLHDLQRAFIAFFEKRAGFPKFKSRKRTEATFRIPQNVRVKGGKVWLSKVGWLKIVQHREVEGTIKSATFKQDATGKWHVCIITEFETSDTPLPLPEPECFAGVDVGLTDFLTTSELGADPVPAPKFARRAERKLCRAHRRLSRRQMASRRRERSRIALARTYRRSADQRKDFVHQQTNKLLKQYDGLCVEDLAVKALARTKLSRSLLDAALGEFNRQVAYKAIWRRKHCVLADRFFPSSQLCSVCGYRYASLTLAEREWSCLQCGTRHERDRNAAVNLKHYGLSNLVAAGRAETLNAQGADVRPATAGCP